MIKHTYEYDIDTKKTTRTIGAVYPEPDILAKGLAAQQPVRRLIPQLQLVYQGIAETPVIETEESWWFLQDTIQTLDDGLSNIVKLLATTTTDRLGTKTDLTKDELQVNKDSLAALLATYNVTSAKDLTKLLKNQQSAAMASRNDLEVGVKKIVTQDVGLPGTATSATTTKPVTVMSKPHLWLQTYRGVTVTETRPVVTGGIPKSVMKQLVAHDRDLNVRNTEDTLADLAKMNSLLFSMVSSMYNAMTVTAQAKIPAAEKVIIEYAIAEFKITTTRADTQLATEGTALIDKLFKREAAISDIVSSLLK